MWAGEAVGAVLYSGLLPQGSTVRLDAGRGEQGCCVVVDGGALRGRSGAMDEGDACVSYGSPVDVGFAGDRDARGRRVTRTFRGRAHDTILLTDPRPEVGWQHMYEHSDQISTLCLVEVDGDGAAAAGVVVQPLPELGGKRVGPTDWWRDFSAACAASRAVGGVSLASLLRGEATADELVAGLAAELDDAPLAQLAQATQLRFHCPCGDDRQALRKVRGRRRALSRV